MQTTELSVKQPALQLFFFSFITCLGHLGSVYFLLTVNNAFNFNNNFHLIGFVSFFTFMVQLLLALLLGRLIQKQSLLMLHEDWTSDDPFQGFSSYALLLIMVFFTILSPLIYFLLINDFMFDKTEAIVGGLAGLAGILILFSYWISFTALLRRQLTLNWWTVVNKIVLFALFCFIFAILINFLAGVIPTAIKPAVNSFVSL